jgi:hypothetical protein
MAERVDVDRPRRRRYYPWTEWVDGNTWRAVEGEDFTCSVNNFQTALHQRARLESMTVETGSPERGIVEFRFSPKGAPAEEPPYRISNPAKVAAGLASPQARAGEGIRDNLEPGVVDE